MGPNVNFSEPPIPFVGEPSAAGTRYMNSAPYFGYRSVTSGRNVERRGILTSGSHETDLLRHFRYHVGPWIDTGDPELPFGLQVLLLSRTNRALQAAVLALSAGQRLLVASPDSKDLESSQKLRKEAEETLVLEYDLARYAGHTLLMLQDALSAGPQQWRSLLVPKIEHISDFASRAVGEEVGDALFWLYFRLGTSTSKNPNKLHSRLTSTPYRSGGVNILFKTTTYALSVIITTRWHLITPPTIDAASDRQLRIQAHIVSSGTLPGPNTRRSRNVLSPHNHITKSDSIPISTTIALPITMDIPLVRLPEMVQ